MLPVVPQQNVHNAYSILTKNLNLNLIKLLDLTDGFQEEGTEGHDRGNEALTSRVQITGNSTGKIGWLQIERE